MDWKTQPPAPADNPFTPIFEAHKHEGSTYQPLLRQFLKEHPEVVVMVETGSGCSTCYATMAFEERGGDGHLFSIDPAPWCSYEVKHARVTNIREPSIDAIVPLYQMAGPFDLFLHDGHHELMHQGYDIAVGFACLRPGGWLWCDDYTWNQHDAWQRFATERGLPFVNYHSAAAIQKPMTIPAMDKTLIQAFSDYTLAKYKLEDERWQAAGGKYHPNFAPKS